MLIGEQYKIESIPLNIVLLRKRSGKKSGKERWDIIAYFSNVENALKCLVDLEIEETGLKDFRAVVEKQRQLYALINSTVMGKNSLYGAVALEEGVTGGQSPTPKHTRAVPSA